MLILLRTHTNAIVLIYYICTKSLNADRFVSMFYGPFQEHQRRKRPSAPHAHWLCQFQACRLLARCRHTIAA